jgi:hypothetical protein
MSIATHEFFKDVQLGPHEETLRRMILSGNPGEPDEYAVLAVAPLFNREFLGDWILPPNALRVFDRKLYRCLIGGLIYSFFVGKADLPPAVLERTISREGNWSIIRQKIEEIPFLVDLAIRMGKAMHQRPTRVQC